MSFKLNINLEKDVKKMIEKKIGGNINVKKDNVEYRSWEDIDKLLTTFPDFRKSDELIKQCKNPPSWFFEKYPEFSEK